MILENDKKIELTFRNSCLNRSLLHQIEILNERIRFLEERLMRYTTTAELGKARLNYMVLGESNGIQQA